MELGNGGLIEQLKSKAAESEANDNGETLNTAPDNQEPLEPIEPAADPEPAPEGNAEPDFELQQEPVANEDVYAPNRSFKVHDESMEFDEFFSPLLVNKDAEKKLRDLHERAYGLDHVKQDRQVLRDDNQKLHTEMGNYNTVKKDLQQLGTYLKNGDMQSFLEAHEISDDQIYGYAMQKLRMQEDPSLQGQYDQNRANQLNQDSQAAEIARLQGQVREDGYQRRENELNFSMSDPIVQQAENEYNSRMGNGAFRSEVISRGQMHYRNTNSDLSAQDAVKQVMSVMGYQQQGQAAPQAQQTYGQTPQYVAPQQAPMQGQQRGKPEVIPNIRGRSSTPVKRIPKSIQELRDLSNQMNG